MDLIFKAISENRLQYAINEICKVKKENTELNIADFITKAIRINDDKVNNFLTELVKEDDWQDWADEVFQEASSKGNVSIVSNLLRTNRTTFNLEINRRGENGETVLHKLLSVGNIFRLRNENIVSVVNLLLENGADVNIKDKRGVSLLHLAALAREIDLVLVIVKNQHFNPSLFTMTDFNGKTPLLCAVEQRGNEEMVTVLLEQENKFKNICCNKSINIRCKGWTVLHHAAKISSDEMCRILLEFGCEVDMRSGSGDTPLHIALTHLNLPVVDVLLENNASVNTKNSIGTSPLHIAINYIHLVPNEYIEKLLKQKANANIKDQVGRTPLHLLAERLDQFNHVIDLLVDYGADVNELNNNLESPLYVSVERGNISMVNYLLNKKANPNARNVNKMTALHLAAYYCDRKAEILETLVTYKAHINASDKHGRTPLYNAVTVSNLSGVIILLKHGACVNASDVMGYTPLHLACSHIISKKIVLSLLEKGADLESTTIHGETPLHLILANESISSFKLVKRFLQHTENINAQQRDGDSLLHIALQGSRLSGRRGWTKLLLSESYKNVIKLLLEKGADIFAKNDKDETPLDIIRLYSSYWPDNIKELFYTQLIKYRAAEFPQAIDNPIIAEFSHTILNTEKYTKLDKSCLDELKLIKESFVTSTSYYDVLKSPTDDIYNLFNNNDIKTLKSSVDKLRTLSPNYGKLIEYKIRAIINRLNQLKLLDDAVIFFLLVSRNLGIPAGPMRDCSLEIIRYLGKYELKLLQILLNKKKASH